MGPWSFPLRCAAAVLVVAAATAAAAAATSLPAVADPVTEWTLSADRLGRNGANWRTLAIMHQAMHDAFNAATPAYARWAPPTADEPAVDGALPLAAVAAAARQVLTALHGDQQADPDSVFAAAIARLPPGPARDAGVRLGRAVGAAAVARRAEDGYSQVRAFEGGSGPGVWRPTPQEFMTSNTTASRPYLFARTEDAGGVPPPELGSERYLRDAAEVRRVGDHDSTARSVGQGEAALYWAYQSGQRGFMHLAAAMLDRHPRPGGLAEHARIMSQFASAMADAAVLTWAEKARYHAWRPVTVLRQGGYGVETDEGWLPLIDTPPHPEYPSGHASDCFTGSGLLAAVFADVPGPVVYVAQSGAPQAEVAAIGMGQHVQPGPTMALVRPFPSFAAVATECSESRVWAGAHFRFANEESRRLSATIVRRALAAVPRLQ